MNDLRDGFCSTHFKQEMNVVDLSTNDKWLAAVMIQSASKDVEDVDSPWLKK